MLGTERALWWAALLCGVLLLPSWLNAKTVRTFEGGGQEIQGWGWQNVASWAGFIAVVALVIGRSRRPRVLDAVLGALIAAVFFASAAAEAARTWLDLYGKSTGFIVVGGVDYALRPATGMDRTVAIALGGAAFALILLGMWLRPGAEHTKTTQDVPDGACD